MIWLLAVIFAFTPTYLIRFHIGPLPTTLLEILVVGFLLIRIWKLEFRSWNIIKTLGKLNWAIGLFVLAGIISTAISPEPIKALGLLRAFILEPILMFYAMLLTIKTKEQLQIILRTVFATTVLISAFGIFQYISFIHLLPKFWGFGNEPRRIVSVFAHPNALSLYLAPLFGLFSALWLNRYPLTKKFWTGLGLVIIGLALVLTYSRGAWLGISVGLVFLLLHRFGWKKILAPVILSGMILLLIPSVQQRLALGLSDPSSEAHLDLMGIAIHKIIQHPVLGNGLYGFRTTQEQANYEGEIHNYPHNIVFALWLEFGFLGLIGFAWIIYLALKKQIKNSTVWSLGASIFLLVLLAHGLVDTPYFRNDLAMLFWFALSLFYIEL